ncbi:MAG: hypothetical protein K0Q73_4453 [Paenibacillus sp.]|jgi:hypothetical protein|nr:hypothetical protein [Paenibacillus sp.]
MHDSVRFIRPIAAWRVTASAQVHSAVLTTCTFHHRYGDRHGLGV